MRTTLNRIFALAACLLMATAVAIATPSPRRPSEAARTAKIKKHQATGEILAVSPTSLILLHARGRGHQRMTFHLTPETRKTVPVFKGKRVTVIYTLDNGRMDALRIRAPKVEKR